MKSRIFFIILLGFLSCQDVKRPEKPNDLIPKDKMIDIIAEAYLINAARSVDHKTLLDKGVKLDSMVYKKYDIDSLQFATSNAYYADNMNEYIDIFQKVEERYDVMLKKMDSVQEIDREKDSLNNGPETVKSMVDEMKDSLI